MQLDNLTLFAANAIVLAVMAGAFALAGRGRRGERYWLSWCFGNLLLALALVGYIIEDWLPPFLVATVPNGLLVIGFGLRWRAAREFAGRAAPGPFVWGPAVVFVALCALPSVSGSYGTVYTVVNVILASLAGAAAWEFWRDRGDALPSRYGLAAAYAVLAVSFAVRVGQGLIDGGSFGYHLPFDTMLMIHLTIALFHSAASGAFALSLAYEHSAGRLRYAATHDALTGLMNRRAFEAAMCDRPARTARPFALLLIDIDHFKRINDRYGHAVGDAVLRHCATLCRRQLRHGDLLARIGGEEFAAVLDGVSPQEANAMAERLCRVVRTERITIDGSTISTTISAGICHSSAMEGGFDAMMRMADSGLYRAKNAGRDRCTRVAA